MRRAIEMLFEEDLAFLLPDGTPLDGSVFIGETEFGPVRVLQSDAAAYSAEFEAWLDGEWLPRQSQLRDQILELHANAKRYADLCAAVVRLQVVPVVGSGMSAPSGLPTWSELLRKIRTFTNVNEAELDDLLKKSAFEEAADLLALGTNPNLLNERVEQDLRIDDPGRIDGSVRLLPEIFPKMVITTNLDDLLEQHYRLCGAGFDHVLAGRDFARFRQLRGHADRFLLKLHGDCRRPDSRVLLKAEYEKAYEVGSDIYQELALLYRTNNLLFLGSSLGPDRTVALVAEVAKQDKSMPKHYGFLRLPGCDEERIERENFLTERQIYPIWYDGDHDECNMALLAGLFEEVSRQ